MTTITGTELVTNIQLDLGLSQDVHKSNIVRWVYESIVDSGVYRADRDKMEVSPPEKEISLPSDCIGIESIEFCGNTCAHPVYDESVSCLCDPDLLEGNSIYTSKQGQMLLFSSNVLTSDIERIVIIYVKIPLGDDGFPTIYTDHYQMCRDYVEWRYASMLRSRHRSDKARNNPISISELQLLQQKYEAERVHTLAKGMGPQNVQQLAQTANIIHSTPKDYLRTIGQSYRELISLGRGSSAYS